MAVVCAHVEAWTFGNRVYMASTCLSLSSCIYKRDVSLRQFSGNSQCYTLCMAILTTGRKLGWSVSDPSPLFSVWAVILGSTELPESPNCNNDLGTRRGEVMTLSTGVVSDRVAYS